MNKKREIHIHKFIKVNGKYIKIWRCANDGCKFMVYTSTEEILIARKSLCWTCGLDFLMDEINLTEEMPTCQKCRIETMGEVKTEELAEHINKMLRENKTQ